MHLRPAGTSRTIRAAADPGLAPRLRAWTLGGALGLLLLVPGWWLRLRGFPAGGFGAVRGVFVIWAPAVAVVATSEEVCLRGLVQPWLTRVVGAPAAILCCALGFAMFHVALYGWQAVPLDLGVGILIGTLRAYTGSVAACALAHTIADIGLWWVA